MGAPSYQGVVLRYRVLAPLAKTCNICYKFTHDIGFRRKEKVTDRSRNRSLVREAKVRFSRRTRNRTVGLRFSAGWFEIPIPLPRPRIQARIVLGSSQEAAEVAEVFSPIPLRCLCVLL